jgi:type III secretion system-like peptide-binding chaperone
MTAEPATPTGPGTPAAAGPAAVEHSGHPPRELAPALPAEAALFDEELDGVRTDLTAKVSEAWRDFARTLAAAIPQLPAGVTLDLTLDPTASGTGEAVYAVQLSTSDAGELTALAVGNALLPEGYRLDRGAVGELVALGWLPPGVTAGSGDMFGLRLPATEANRLAVVVSRTMRDVYGAPHPAFLTYLAHRSSGEPVHIPPLGAARQLTLGDDEEPSDESATERALSRLSEELDQMPLNDRVVTVVASLLKTTPDELPVDPDGDIGIRSGSAMVFVRVRDNPPLIDVFSPVLTDVEPTEQLYVKLSELTNRMPIGRLYCTNDTVWASVPVFGRDFQPSHLMLAVQVMTGLADELDDRLHGEFGGKRFFGEGDKPAIRSGSERTGMYL